MVHRYQPLLLPCRVGSILDYHDPSPHLRFFAQTPWAAETQRTSFEIPSQLKKNPDVSSFVFDSEVESPVACIGSGYPE